MAAFEEGDMEEAHQIPIHLYADGGGVCFGMAMERLSAKVILKQLGVDCGPCRLPLQTFSSPNWRQKSSAELEALGFWKALEAARH